MKTLLAWSSIENIGLIFSVIGAALFAETHGPVWLMPAALAIALFLSLNHALFKSGLFMSAGTLAHLTHTRDIEQLGGLAQKLPTFSRVVLLLTLAGAALPPAGAFVGEWVFLRALFIAFGSAGPVEKILYALIFALVGLIGGLGVFAMVRFFGITFLGQSRQKDAHTIDDESKGHIFYPIFALGIGTLLLGLFGPFIFALLLGDFQSHTNNDLTFSAYLTHGFSIVSFLFVAVSLCAYLIQKFLIAPAPTRMVDTWDCGQPITPRMQYSGAGFAAPIRFFFLVVLQSKKIVTRTPLVETNPYVQSTSVSIVKHPFFDRVFYAPITKMIRRTSHVARQLHKGAIGAYFVMMIITIVLSLTIGLWIK
jgi:hydrogenase-4 component B